jgi:PadR family transcriptional regulator PadR
MVEELARHGYRRGPGSLYPLLQGLEKKGYLRSTEVRSGKSLRRVYRATPLGRKALAGAKHKIRELFREVVKGEIKARRSSRGTFRLHLILAALRSSATLGG